jgi:peptidyl-prolyl cis-trans isomerase C
LLSGTRFLLSLAALAGLSLLAQAQAPDPKTPPAPAPPPAEAPLPPPPDNAVAATVNGRPILERAVYRALRQVPKEKRDEARKEIVNFLVENAIIDQYLEALKVTVDPKDVDAQFLKVKKEIEDNKQKFEDMLKKLYLTEAELRTQIAGQLRWDKFVDMQGKEPVLRNMFDKNKEMFDGSMVKARHLLLSPAKGDAQAAADAKAKLAGFKKQAEDAGQDAVSKLAAGADNLAKEKARAGGVEGTFADLAKKESSCPSKVQGGDIGWFPRAGRMVEPFARAAFALKPYQISEPVQTEFGYHLILVTERRAGKDVKFEDVREMVKDVYSDRLREAVLAQMRPRARIVINPAKQ